jgi:hypothetical protein
VEYNHKKEEKHRALNILLTEREYSISMYEPGL